MTTPAEACALIDECAELYKETTKGLLSRWPKPQPEVHAEWDALLLSLEAVAEAIGTRPFSWACTKREKRAAQHYAVGVALRGAMQ